MDRGAWWAMVHRVTKSGTRLKQQHALWTFWFSNSRIAKPPWVAFMVVVLCSLEPSSCGPQSYPMPARKSLLSEVDCYRISREMMEVFTSHSAANSAPFCRR